MLGLAARTADPRTWQGEGLRISASMRPRTPPVPMNVSQQPLQLPKIHIKLPTERLIKAPSNINSDERARFETIIAWAMPIPC